MTGRLSWLIAPSKNYGQLQDTVHHRYGLEGLLATQQIQALRIFGKASKSIAFAITVIYQ
jgi:hypothetical protein